MPTYLEQLTKRPLAKPCGASWEAMAGDDKTRLCAQCDRRVYHLSAMTRMEAEIRLLNAEGLPCVRYTLDPLGHVALQPGPTAPWPRPSRALLTAGALAVAALGPEARAADPGAPPAAVPPGAQCARPVPPTSAPVPAPGPSSPGPSSPPPPPQVPLAGAPMPPPQPVPQGVLEVRSATVRPFRIAGVEFQAPARAIQLPPGKHALQVHEAGKPVRTLTVTIRQDARTVVSLDPSAK